METECGTVIEFLEHNKALEQSPDYQKIILEVDNEVYRQFALEHIQMAEQDMAEYGDYEDTFDDEFDAPTEYDIYLSKRSNRIKEAKRLLKEYPDQPIHAARLWHWIWYVFPQMKGLGKSEISQFYGINGREEAKAYIEHPILRERLVEISEAVLNNEKSVYDIFGQDAIKVRSCILLFASVCDISVFKQLKSKYRW